MKGRILHVVGDSQFGGASVLILRLAEAAQKNGYDVSILCTAPMFQKAIQEAGLKYVSLDCIWREIRPFKDIRGLRSLYRYLKTHRYDIIHTHTSKAGFIGRAAAFMAGVPKIVHTVHGFPFHEQSSPIALYAYSNLEKLAAHWCHKIITVSEYHKNWGLSLGIGDKDKVMAIPNGISENRVRNETTTSLLRQELAIDPEDFVMVSTGRLATQKGLAHLVQATKKLVDGGRKNIRVVLAGDGPLRNDLEEMVNTLNLKDYFKFLGFRTDIADILAAGDLAVMPTEWEGLSISLLEAMAAGKPIVTTTIGSNLEVTENGKYAKLVPPKEVDALAVAIEEIIQNPDAAKKMGESARIKFLDTYTEYHMLSKYVNLYNEMISQTKN